MTLVVNVNISSVNYDVAVEQIAGWAKTRERRYVCAANVHMIMEAFDSPVFRQVVNQADLVVPDGMPLVWMMRLKGRKLQKRVYGPTLMLHILDAAQNEKIAVGFYGSMPEVLTALINQLQARYPTLNIGYSFSPPYHDLNSEENLSVIRVINNSQIRILFVGLGCPKQEIWMAEHLEKVNAVMIGVGAAFDFHAGIKSQAPAWMQKIGLEWLYRLMTEPRRLWRRYLYHNPRFVFLAILDLLGFPW